MRNILFSFIFSLLILSLNSCDSKDEGIPEQDNKGEFGWTDKVELSSIPDYPVKGYLNGREVTFSYINFEKWRGSNDNVINFSVNKPEQQCGFIENFEGFSFINKGSQITTGETIKTDFNSSSGSYNAYYQVNTNGSSVRSNSPFAYAIKIDSMDDKKVTGKIAVTFNDDKKNWIAGKFEALICNN